MATRTRKSSGAFHWGEWSRAVTAEAKRLPAPPTQTASTASRPTRIVFKKPLPHDPALLARLSRETRKVLARVATPETGQRRRINHGQDSFTTVRVGEVWVEEDVGDWRAAYRLGVDNNGTVVVSEFRLFPKAEATEPGQWIGEWMGVEAPGVPAGGISARTIKACRVGLRAGRTANVARADLLDLMQRGYGSLAPVLSQVEQEEGPTRGPGRPPKFSRAWSEQFAARYTEIAKGSRERNLIVTLMREYNLTRDQVKTRVRRCRELDLLI